MLIGIVLAGYFGPWWAPAAFIVMLTALSGMNARQSLITGGALLSLAYLGLASALSLQDEADIIARTGVLLGNLSPQLLVLITTFIGTITGALAGWLGSETGHFVRSQLKKEVQP